jgi:hypothetical protein
MARGVLDLNQITRTGVAVTEVTGDAANNHQVANNGDTYILAHNSGAGARTITFVINKAVDGVTPTPVARSLAAGASKLFGPFPVSLYGSTLLINVEHAEMKLSAYSK